MDAKYAISSAVILGLIGLEAAWARARGRRYYTLGDAVSNLSTFFSAEIVTIFIVPPTALAFEALRARCGLFAFDASSVRDWALCLVGADLCYYWMHRVSHRVSFLWALHVVHHQSEEYNLSVGPRKAVLSKLSYPPFYAPLALLGFPATMIFVCITIDAFYQLVLHTRAVGKLGPIERVFCTPSNHRVHHGTEPEYLDRNYGGIFIVWDRIFGTFTEETKEPRYGSRHPVGSHSLVAANLQHWKVLAEASRREPGPWRKLALGFLPPERVHGRAVAPPPPAAKPWAPLAFGVAVAAAVVVLESQERLPLPLVAAMGLPVIGLLAGVTRWVSR
jgi:sterol desaturase/sphingolipid hydroxylase (fatty acid hydroxylase superfamily)